MRTLICFSFFVLPVVVAAQRPLSTSSRWIVNEEGMRVKFRCVNWVSHLETLLAEGLNKRPIDNICQRIVTNGFNCVRFTWPVALPTNTTLASTTISEQFKSFGLNEALQGIKEFNPDFVDYTILQAFKTVVERLGANKIMVILDNHISRPGWCCHTSDGNGFFGDQYFNTTLWLKGLEMMASLFNSTENVVAMSLRNELRGPNQNATIWRKIMVEAAEMVHKANPHVLVILSGLSFDTDLTFVKEDPVNLTFTNKLVYEIHWYGITFGTRWKDDNANDVCGYLLDTFLRNGGFLLGQGHPLFVSEFGGDQTGSNKNDNRFLECMFGLLADLDLDWALWALQGSYYLREGVVDLNETYGLLDIDWKEIRNQSFTQRLQAIQPQYQGPGKTTSPPYQMIFHPLSGLCISPALRFIDLKLSHCKYSGKWQHTYNKAIILQENHNQFCLDGVDVGVAPKLDAYCNSTNAKWELIASSRMHISSTLSNGVRVCLDVDRYGGIITNLCKCLEKDPTCEPSSQWFKIVVAQDYIA